MVDHRLVLVGDGSDLGGPREDHVEIANLQQIGLAGRTPILCRRTLTPWAMTVATRVVGDAAVAAILAALDMAPTGQARGLKAHDPKHLGARIGATAVLHTWGSAMTHHPHVHMIVPGGGISLDGTRWGRCKPGFLLPVRVLCRLFRRLFRAALANAHAAGRLALFGEIEGLRRRKAFAAYLAPLMRKNWFVYAKPPFAGPEAVLAYLARYTHRLAIANSRLVALDKRGVTFRYKDYRRNGQARYLTMMLSADEFIRRFLLHVLPKGFHRIRHYGLLASAGCKANIARAKELMAAPMPAVDPPAAHDTADIDATTTDHRPTCPCCGGRMIIVEVFARGGAPRGPPSTGAGIRI